MRRCAFCGEMIKENPKEDGSWEYSDDVVGHKKDCPIREMIEARLDNSRKESGMKNNNKFKIKLKENVKCKSLRLIITTEGFQRTSIELSNPESSIPKIIKVLEGYLSKQKS